MATVQNRENRVPTGQLRIGVMAPGRSIDRAVEDRVRRLAEARYGNNRVSLHFHAQCFSSHGHFAGSDGERASAFLEIANSRDYDCLWFARGGYGACRLADEIFAGLEAPAREKIYLGYSDTGFLLAGLYARGVGRPVHGPMPIDITRAGGDAAIIRALDYLVTGDGAALEPHVVSGPPVAAFNITVLSQLLGTPLEPDLSGHVIMLEDVHEYIYRLDRFLFHITSNPGVRRAAGLRLGRCSDILENDPDFGQSMDEIFAHWCAVSGLANLGAADIGHDSANKIVPFGAAHNIAAS